MKEIKEYPIRIFGLNKIEMPKGAVILCAAYVSGQLTLYAEVDKRKEIVNRHIVALRNCEELPPGISKYVNSLMPASHDFIVHIYDQGETE